MSDTLRERFEAWAISEELSICRDITLNQFESYETQSRWQAVQAMQPPGDDTRDALLAARRELHACQAVIHLHGGFDSAYVTGAQAALKLIDAAIAGSKL